MTISPSFLPLFGLSKPWFPTPWTTTDDRVRGGASQSYLTALPNNGAHFYGHLDTSVLGGAGFASQFSPLDIAGSEKGENYWDLSAYDGIEIDVVKGEGKMYTLIFKDEEQPEKRGDGREKAAVNWEVEFFGAASGDGGGEGVEAKGGAKVWVPWEKFKATYRGKEKEDAGSLKTREVRRVGLMMRSYFGKQEGDFSLELKSICARKRKDGEDEKSISVL